MTEPKGLVIRSIPTSPERCPMFRLVSSLACRLLRSAVETAASGAGVPAPTVLHSFVEREKESQTTLGGEQAAEGLESAAKPAAAGANESAGLDALARELSGSSCRVGTDRSETPVRSGSTGSPAGK